MHLSERELVDLAEGSRPESSAPHLAACERCRRQMIEMRSVMAEAAAVEVPEPSPLFWDHLSARVRESVALEREAPRRWWHELTATRLLVPASAMALAAIVIASASMLRLLAPETPAKTILAGEVAGSVAGGGPEDLDDPADDASLMLVADLSAEINLDQATDSTLAPRGSAEHVVTHLDDDELRELQRLLQQELTPSGV